MFDATPRITDLDLHMDQLADLVRYVGGVVECTYKADRLTVAYPKVPLCLFILVFFFQLTSVIKDKVGPMQDGQTSG